MSDFPDLDSFLGDTLALPIGGRVYEVHPPPMEDGLRIELVLSVGRKARDLQARRDAGEADVPDLSEDDLRVLEFDGQSQEDLYRMALGAEVHDRMVADGVPLVRIRLAGGTALAWISSGFSAETALQVWTAAGRPQPPAPAAPPGSSAAVSTTRRPASGSGTKTRKTRAAAKP